MALVAVVPPALFHRRVIWLTCAVPTAGTVALRPFDIVNGSGDVLAGSIANACV